MQTDYNSKEGSALKEMRGAHAGGLQWLTTEWTVKLAELYLDKATEEGRRARKESRAKNRRKVEVTELDGERVFPIFFLCEVQPYILFFLYDGCILSHHIIWTITNEFLFHVT